ncbi:transmembrane reductase CYB561D2 isoform X1 [Gavia stellata]|uniref:transmembrane reductase CYB561D2 isoform X1 n=1 Tax=Gavia stellata TaxID=37040 RepID=UPI00289BD41E|nr:transmembrane reductase CYB561D2 isoform X1 [Gavia stellata]
MALTAETESRLYRSLRAAAGAVAHLVALGFPTAVAVLARPGSSLFSWHPLLMALAVSPAPPPPRLPATSPCCAPFSFLMTEALLIFSPETSLLRSFSRKVKVRVHWVLQLLALLCALLGLGVITYNKHLNGKAHFVTWHGLTGLLTVLYAGGQCMGGVLLLYPKLMKNWTLAKLKLYHATSGLVGYLLGCASLMLGMCSLWFTTSVTSVSWYLAMLCPLLTSLVIMNQVSNAYLYRKRSQH